jgi:hypothetical protein
VAGFGPLPLFAFAADGKQRLISKRDCNYLQRFTLREK